MTKVLYVYAVARAQTPLPESEAVDGSRNFVAVEEDGLTAIATPVDEAEFSQEAIDAHTNDLEWLGRIGSRHQQVVSGLAGAAAIVPLRAFTLFRSEESLRRFLEANSDALVARIGRIGRREEWTIRVEFEPEKWNDALVARVASLAALARESAASGGGKAYLLRKKLDDERKRAAREAEESVVHEIDEALRRQLAAPTIVETRQQRGGSFPQINVLLDRGRSNEIAAAADEMNREYAEEGITLVLTGPWPPYTFAAEDA